MKYHLSFVLLLTPFSVFATLHCPEIDSISQRGGIYLAATTEGAMGWHLAGRGFPTHSG